MESDTLTCPFCGAPYRGTIPSRTVQVKCPYCGAAILVPTYFGGTVNRCPNHPNIAAVGICNDCGRSYCEDCLSLHNVEHGTLYLCPTCFKIREGDRTIGPMLFGVLVSLLGFFIMFVAPGPEGIVAGVTFIGVVALPFLAWGLYRSANPSHGRSLKEMKEETRLGMSFRKLLRTRCLCLISMIDC